VATPTPTRPGRIIGALLVLIALVFGLIYVVAPDHIGKERQSLGTKFSPRLGLDLEGGTSVILTPRSTTGEKPSKAALAQAVSIIRSRVDSFGVAEAEVSTAGNNIVISVPGKQDKNILATVQKTAQLRFRRVLLSGSGVPVAPEASPSPSASPSGSATSSPSPSPSATKTKKKNNQNGIIPKAFKVTSTSPSPSSSATPTVTPTTAASPSPTATAPPATPDKGIGVVPITPELQKEFDALDCTKKAAVRLSLRAPGADRATKPLVTCDQDGAAKYILGPAVVLGTEVKSASAGLEQSSGGVTTGGW